jgi:Holliday junction resolvasome RuvABC endonuclease subunit
MFVVRTAEGERLWKESQKKERLQLQLKRKRQDKDKKKKKPWKKADQMIRFRVTHLYTPMLLVGIDLSLNSPGLCFQYWSYQREKENEKEESSTVTDLYFFPQLKRELSVRACFNNGNLKQPHLLNIIPLKPLKAKLNTTDDVVPNKQNNDVEEEKNENELEEENKKQMEDEKQEERILVDKLEQRDERFSKIIETIMEVLKQKMDHYKLKKEDIHIAIEGYSYNSVSSSTSLLCELGGILRYQLYTHGYHYREIPPTSNKQIFTGSGTATKLYMYDTWKNRFHLPDLFDVFQKKKNCCKLNPLEDCVDAYALVHCLYDQSLISSGKIKNNRLELCNNEKHNESYECTNNFNN